MTEQMNVHAAVIALTIFTIFSHTYIASALWQNL